MECKPGDVLIHKATKKRCVVKEVEKDEVIVTTSDDEIRKYKIVELEPT